ncbi:hypothetical protein Hanom_Chr03g00244671 [Helianthus anomalus]
MDGVNEPDENARFQTFWIQMRKNKPLDEIRKTGQTSWTTQKDIIPVFVVVCLHKPACHALQTTIQEFQLESSGIEIHNNVLISNK